MTRHGIRITERDVSILQFVNEFGFCEIRHVQNQFGIKKRLCYSLMQRLVLGGFVTHQHIYHNQHGIYRATHLGASYTDLPPLNIIPHNHYHHHLTVIDVYQKMKQYHAAMTWVSERQLISEKFSQGVGKRGHIADGMLLLPNKKVAIEVELTVKGRARLERILKGYAKQADIDEIWYFCQQKTFNALRPFVEKMSSLVKTILVEDFLHG
jgi:hypothetical protein